MALVFLVAVAFFVQAVSGNMQCEDLPTEICSFSVASSGRRCVLENYPTGDGTTRLECKTSTVSVEFLQGWIETDECVNACGLDRNAVGISSDTLLQRGFVKKLCAPGCYDNCPNIIDLYFSLALAEGGFLPEMCKSHGMNLKRAMSELSSSGDAFGSYQWIANGPSGEIIVSAPAESPAAVTISI
ncbi:hypothetical protein MLD38_014798 [Melastoma candidum]|uniref:Uncharacterized protein n=1 Tax=Melastoma candidum TaxID=119954 RepID=A0ACB9RE13_9MYRT|nr:hypothetical protein MLD38_014798 [Melastoma candidum]